MTTGLLKRAGHILRRHFWGFAAVWAIAFLVAGCGTTPASSSTGTSHRADPNAAPRAVGNSGEGSANASEVAGLVLSGANQNPVEGAFGLKIPATHPRVWFNAGNLEQARKWYKAHPFTPKDTGDDRIFLSMAAHYLMSGDPADCKAVISNALGQSYTDAQLQGAGPDGPRQNGDAIIVAALDWCSSQLTTAQKSTLLTNWNHYLSVLVKYHQAGQWGGPDMPFSNYNWGYLRNNITWGMVTYQENPESAKAFLDDGLNSRWAKNFAPIASRPGPAGGLGGMPQEGSEYGRYQAYYSLLPFFAAKQMGRDVYGESTFFRDMVYWLIYETPASQSENLGWQPFPWADDENWAQGNAVLRGASFPDFMTMASNNWAGTKLAQYARQWLNMTGAKPDPWVAALDNGGPAASFASLPLDFYAPGYQQMYGQNGWKAENTRFLWQMGAPTNFTHNHKDWGTFQIWKKGHWLTRESVAYAQPLAGPAGNGLVDSNSVFAHNGILFGSVQIKSGTGPITVTRLESRPEYAYAADNLGMPAPQNWVREFIFVRDLETTVILDRINTNNAGMSTTFLLHAETNPVIEDKQHLTITSGPEALRISILMPAAPTIGVVKEGGPGQFRIEALNDKTGGPYSYFLTVLQAKDAGATNLSPSVVDSAPNSLLSGTFRVVLDASHSIQFNKGMSSTGGSITISGKSIDLRQGVEPITLTTDGIAWGP
jgi:hypothetical protein